MEVKQESNQKILEIDPSLELNYNKLQKTTNYEILRTLSQGKRVFASSLQGDQTLIDLDPSINYNKHKLNGFTECLRMSYQYHIPLILSPDILWTAIIQGFSQHVNCNAEALRDKFVTHSGQKTLTVISEENNLTKINWEEVIKGFSVQIKDNIGEKIHKNLVPKFSTTQRIDTISFEIALMDSMQSYFKYAMVGGCGIPKIKLLGTKEDWEQLLSMTKSLREFELEWWIDYLVPVLEKIYQTYLGKMDKDFWNDIYQYRDGGGSGPPATADGWIINFFPYLVDFFESKPFRVKQFRDINNKKQEKINLNTYLIPNGKNKAPVEYTDLINKTKTNLLFYSGFLSVQLDQEGFIKPLTGWAILQK